MGAGAWFNLGPAGTASACFILVGPVCRRGRCALYTDPLSLSHPPRVTGETAMHFCTVPLSLYLFRPWLSRPWIFAIPVR